MKLHNTVRWSGLAGILLTFTGCVPIDPALLNGGGGGGYNNGPRYSEPSYQQHDHDDGNFGQASFQKGLSCGTADGQSRKSKNPYRYRGEYNERYASSFVQGYEQAYERAYHANDHAGHDHDDDNDRGSSRGGNNYFGGPDQWYRSGYMLGKRDRQRGVSCEYNRHNTQYDGRTRQEFARGYEEGYRR